MQFNEFTKETSGLKDAQMKGKKETKCWKKVYLELIERLYGYLLHIYNVCLSVQIIYIISIKVKEKRAFFTKKKKRKKS